MSSLDIPSFRHHLSRRKFIVTYEPDSPKGTDVERYLTYDVPKKVAALCLYNNPRGQPRLDPFIYGLKLRERYKKDIIANIRMQDYSPPLFQSILWGGHILGIRNLLLITGDYRQDSPFHIDVTEGITGITRYLNNGLFMPDLSLQSRRYINRYLESGLSFFPEKFDGKTDFFVGSALVTTRQKEYEIYEKKVAAGSNFFMTQLTYSPQPIMDFIEKVEPVHPILVGSGPITSLKRIQFYKEQLKIPGISQDLIKRLKSASDMGKESVQICIEMYHTLHDFAKEGGYVLGAHVMSIRSPLLAFEIIRGI